MSPAAESWKSHTAGVEAQGGKAEARPGEGAMMTQTRKAHGPAAPQPPSSAPMVGASSRSCSCFWLLGSSRGNADSESAEEGRDWGGPASRGADGSFPAGGRGLRPRPPSLGPAHLSMAQGPGLTCDMQQLHLPT